MGHVSNVFSLCVNFMCCSNSWAALKTRSHSSQLYDLLSLAWRDCIWRSRLCVSLYVLSHNVHLYSGWAFLVNAQRNSFPYEWISMWALCTYSFDKTAWQSSQVFGAVACWFMCAHKLSRLAHVARHSIHVSVSALKCVAECWMKLLSQLLDFPHSWQQ